MKKSDFIEQIEELMRTPYAEYTARADTLPRPKASKTAAMYWEEAFRATICQRPIPYHKKVTLDEKRASDLGELAGQGWLRASNPPPKPKRHTLVLQHARGQTVYEVEPDIWALRAFLARVKKLKTARFK